MPTTIDPSYILSMTNKFNSSVAEHIVNIFKDEHIIVTEDMPEYPNALNVADMNDQDIITNLVSSHNLAALKQLEMWEFTSNYPYSVLCEPPRPKRTGLPTP